MRHLTAIGIGTGIALCALAMPRPVEAEDLQHYALVLKNHRFTPAELHVPTGKAFMIDVTNNDPVADEFEMQSPAVEKIVPPGGSVSVRIRPLGKGKFPFIGEFFQQTANGVIVSE